MRGTIVRQSTSLCSQCGYQSIKNTILIKLMQWFMAYEFYDAVRSSCEQQHMMCLSKLRLMYPEKISMPGILGSASNYSSVNIGSLVRERYRVVYACIVIIIRPSKFE